ncbi:MAG: InlB B-repeat-containing protein, partial [Clostridiales Family XIII bacterium]|nr:InlB B-repeat-containing protein [Clostridiales Family XIII bacterium]
MNRSSQKALAFLLSVAMLFTTMAPTYVFSADALSQPLVQTEGAEGTENGDQGDTGGLAAEGAPAPTIKFTDKDGNVGELPGVTGRRIISPGAEGEGPEAEESGILGEQGLSRAPEGGGPILADPIEGSPAEGGAGTTEPGAPEGGSQGEPGGSPGGPAGAPSRPGVSTEPAVTTEPAVSTEPAITTEPAVSTEPAVTTEPAVSTEPAITTEAGLTSEEAIEFAPQSAGFIVEFIVPDGISGPAAQIVTMGGLAEDPGPVDLPASATMVAFEGWFLEGSFEQFDFENTAIEGDIELHARYRDYFLVSFYNGFDQVFLTKHVMPGQTLAALTPAEMGQFRAPVGEYFDHWALLDEDGDELREFFPGVERVNGDIYVKGVTIENMRYVFFFSEGSQVPFQTVPNGGRAAKPDDPSRVGYAFKQWSTTIGGAEFRFGNTPITEDTVLYAVWTPLPAKYEIVFWKEKANIPGDPLLRAPDGSLERLQPNFEFQTMITGSALSDTPISSMGIDTIIENRSALYPLYSIYTRGDYFATSETILGNGTTVINVYFKKKTYTVYFYIGNDSAGTVEYNTAKDRYSMTVGGNVYGWTNNIGNPASAGTSNAQLVSQIKASSIAPYSFTAKYEEDISDRWPSLSNVVKNGGNAYSATAFKAKHTTALFSTVRLTFTADLIPTDGGSELAVWTLWENGKIRVNLHYMVESLDNGVGEPLPSIISSPGADPSARYIEDAALYDSIWTDANRTVMHKDIEGSLPNGEVLYKDNAGVYVLYNVKELQKRSGMNLYLFYNRVRNPITFNTVGGSPAVLNTEPGLNYSSVKFGDNLEKYIPKTNPTKLEYGIEYSFAGWYYDADYYRPYAPGDLMGTEALTLYAKWTSKQFVVRQYDSMGTDSTPVAVLYKGYNEYVNPAELAYQPGVDYRKGEFIGWKIYVGPGLAHWFSFSTPITADINLHADWDAPSYNVIYHPNNTPAGLIHNSGDEPIDPIDYETGAEARVHGNEGNLTFSSGSRPLTFVGWETSEVSVVYYRNNVVTIGEEDIHLYPRAVLAGQLGQMNYHANYVRPGESSEEIVVQPTAKNRRIQLPDEEIFSEARAYYRFLGWSTTPSGGVEYAPRDEYLYGSLNADHLYAVWAPAIMYTVEFLVGEYGTALGTTRYSVAPGYTLAEAGVTPPAVTPDSSHIFLGWSPEFDPTVQVTRNMTYGALYRPKETVPEGWVRVTPYDGIYDARAHSITAVGTGTTPMSIEFREDAGAWGSVNPAYKNVNNAAADKKYVVWVRFSVDGYLPYVTSSYVRITKAALEVIAPSATVNLYDGIPTNAAWTLTYNGFVGGEGPSALSGAGIIAVPGFVLGTPGKFPVKASGYASGNYSISYTDGELEVLQALAPGGLVKEVWDDVAKAYSSRIYVNDRDQELTYRIRFKLPSDLRSYSTLDIQDLLPASLALKSPYGVTMTAAAVGGAPIYINGAVSVKYPAVGGGVLNIAFGSGTDWESLQGATVSIVIPTLIKPAAPAGAIMNKARLLVNDTASPTLPGQAPEEPSIEVDGPVVVLTDKVDDLTKDVYSEYAGGYTGETLYIDDRNAELDYRIMFTMPEDTTSMASIEVHDAMPAGMRLASTPAVSIRARVQGGAAVAGTASYDAATNTAKFAISPSGGGFAAYAGRAIVVEIDARLTGAGPGALVNRARVLVNGKNPAEATGPSVVVTDPIDDLRKLVQDPETGEYTG